MKIGIDISQIVYETGVSVYTKNLVKNLLIIDKNNEYVLFGSSLRRSAYLKSFLTSLQGDALKKLFPFPPVLLNLIWNKLHTLPIEKLIGKIDVFHSSDWTQPPTNALKVTTVHDLSPLKFPDETHPKIVNTHKLRLEWVKKEVDRVIVPSKTTREDALEFGIPEKKIIVIPEAPDPIFKPSGQLEVQKLKRKYKIDGNYILSIGANPRKNTKRIIDAFMKLKRSDLKLVIVGQPYFGEVTSSNVIFLGHAKVDDMPILYSGAEALVYPSLYEGFGLPILESFACHTPVVTSKFGSMAEVAGGAAVLVDAYNVDSIAEGITEAINKREILINRGLTRIRDFSWEKTAKDTLEVYNEQFM